MPIVGDVLADRYRLEAVLGVGGMASVFRATDLRLDRQVALKVLAANLAAHPVLAERFDREARAMASFSHPSVAAVYDVEPGDPAAGREPFYVMEYCEGGSLADRLEALGPMSPDDLVPIVAAVADGLVELHARGLIHRDVKPANILFATDRPKLADFGIARDDGQADADALTLPGSTLGTPEFLAPEVLAGQPATAAGDVYGLGVTTFLALTGRYPGPAGADPALPLRASAAAPGLGSSFDAPIAAALDPNPANRPSPAELASDLGAGLAGQGVARPNPGAIDPIVPVDPVVAVDPAAPTIIAAPGALVVPAAPAPAANGPAPAAVPSAVSTPARASARPRAGGWPALAGPAILLALLALAVILLLPRLLGGAGVPVGSPGPTASSSTTAGPSAPAAVLASLDRVDAAIEAARGGKDGLTGRDANELAQLAGSVRSAVAQGDLPAARVATATLSDRAQELAKGLDETRRAALFDAIAALEDALGR
jgi:eukaryotic-like serine/threonine-protein kinase